MRREPERRAFVVGKSAVDSLFTGLSEAERRRVFGDDTAEVYRFF